MNVHTERRMVYWLFILPALFLIAFVFLIPLGKSIQMSFYDMKFVEKAPFIGIGNYKRMFNDDYFLNSLKATFLYTAIYTVGVFLLGFITALFLNMSFRGNSTVRAITTLPYAIPESVGALVWLWMLDYQLGVINYLLGKPQPWLFQTPLALFAVVGIEVWKLFPMHALILLAGLQGIPQELYEAASIDGANSVQKFFRITIPQLKQILAILLTLTIIWCFKRFTTIWVLTQGGPHRSTETFVIQIYRYAFAFNRMGYAATIGTFVLAILVGLTLLYFFLIRQGETS
jgi:multiple sugar transport system permease protein